jgi:hypothetical protein
MSTSEHADLSCSRKFPRLLFGEYGNSKTNPASNGT